MNLMIVDDEKILRNGFKHMTDWSSKGIHIISEAINGQDALEKIKIQMPDVVLTDIKMPVMNGIELTKKISKIYPHIKVIVLSGYDDYQFVRESMKYGAVDYLLKASVDADEVYDILSHLAPNTSSQFAFEGTEELDIHMPSMDKNTIKKFIELKDYNSLGNYIYNFIEEQSHMPILYIKDELRDLFFYTQFQLEQHGLPHKFMGDIKLGLSRHIESLTDITGAHEWSKDFIHQLQRLDTSFKINTHIRDVINLIEKEYAMYNLSLSYIADTLHLNKNYLCDLFKTETDTTINQYISNIRINHSKELMRNTSLTLNEIAQTVGYTDYNYFSRVFRKNMGIPPSKYHQMYS